jgi:hypothetical protein
MPWRAVQWMRRRQTECGQQRQQQHCRAPARGVLSPAPSGDEWTHERGHKQETPVTTCEDYRPNRIQTKRRREIKTEGGREVTSTTAKRKKHPEQPLPTRRGISPHQQRSRCTRQQHRQLRRLQRHQRRRRQDRLPVTLPPRIKHQERGRRREIGGERYLETGAWWQQRQQHAVGRTLQCGGLTCRLTAPDISQATDATPHESKHEIEERERGQDALAPHGGGQGPARGCPVPLACSVPAPCCCAHGPPGGHSIRQYQ